MQTCQACKSRFIHITHAQKSHDTTIYVTTQQKTKTHTLNDSTKRKHVLNKLLGDSMTACPEHRNIFGKVMGMSATLHTATTFFRYMHTHPWQLNITMKHYHVIGNPIINGP